jgi:hypothetical protein
MKKLIIAILFFLLVLTPLNHAYACTCFAVYSDKPIYAMNFDYPETELKFVITEDKETKALFMQFKVGNNFSPTVGMNDKGLFVTTQMQYPQIPGQNSRTKDEIFIPELGDYIQNCKNVQEILQAVENKKFVQLRSLTLHNMLADMEGNAVITEAGDEKNELLPITGNFLVMTNFRNSDYKNKPLNEISGTGSDRYIKAYQYIDENKEGFHLDKALEGLKMTVQNGSYPTLSSMVFVPEENCVYIALHRDFERLWKIYIQDKTIETFKGFDADMKFYIPDNGIFASDLINNDFTKYKAYEEANTTAVKSVERSGNDGGSKDYFIYLYILALFVALFLVVYILIKKRKIN